MLSLELTFERRVRILNLIQDGSSSSSASTRMKTLHVRRRRRLSGGATIDVAYEIRLRGDDAESKADAVAGNIEAV